MENALMIETASDATHEPRHARLFELIRQHNLRAMQASGGARPSAQTTGPTAKVHEFAQSARQSLSPEEQQALGITASFGR
ncbi:hypothetical protein [Marimonas lutisalis]|uniref:hypothetical protein n=1 Tax=Marimonas lutisalis TaxID=2545756 RepID=UPI0010F860F7|nr:hypothetical protein [Marimonas lutisalis]